MPLPILNHISNLAKDRIAIAIAVDFGNVADVLANERISVQWISRYLLKENKRVIHIFTTKNDGFVTLLRMFCKRILMRDLNQSCSRQINHIRSINESQGFS